MANSKADGSDLLSIIASTKRSIWYNFSPQSKSNGIKPSKQKRLEFEFILRVGMMEYKGCHAKIEYSPKDDAFAGKVFGIAGTLQRYVAARAK